MTALSSTGERGVFVSTVRGVFLGGICIITRGYWHFMGTAINCFRRPNLARLGIICIKYLLILIV